jgi:hypothetical protein
MNLRVTLLKIVDKQILLRGNVEGKLLHLLCDHPNSKIYRDLEERLIINLNGSIHSSLCNQLYVTREEINQKKN